MKTCEEIQIPCVTLTPCADTFVVVDKETAVELVQRLVRELYGVTISDLGDRRRFRNGVLVRNAIYYTLYKYTSLSLNALTRLFNHANHTSALHAINRSRQALLGYDAELRDVVLELESNFVNAITHKHESDAN